MGAMTEAAPHYHAWFRAGRIFTMHARRFGDRTVAHKWAARQRPSKDDRLILACVACPVSRPSRRRPIRWGHVAKAIGVELPALRAAIEAERRRAVAAGGNEPSQAREGGKDGEM